MDGNQDLPADPLPQLASKEPIPKPKKMAANAEASSGFKVGS